MERQQIVVELSQFGEWLEAQDVHTGRSRIPGMLSTISQVMEADDPARLIRALPLNEKLKIMTCFFDAFSFTMIHRQMARLSSNRLPRAALREAIKGPLDPAEEVNGEDSTKSRNFMYELELASRLMAAGRDVIAFDDLVLEIQGIRINVQCKRPRRRGNVTANFAKAVEQIRVRVNNHGGYGIVAICLDKSLDVPASIHFPTTPDELTAYASALASISPAAYALPEEHVRHRRNRRHL